ncbi:MAG: hypothetical protein BIFFINMI_03585 [Phycisphaerae bacterium]|nr:hypothetical protein [Phycisphaerae bacterium]
MAKQDGKATGNPTAYSYVRWSTREQTRGDSKRRQSEWAKRVCKDKGYTLDDTVYADQGVSAFKGANSDTGDLRRFLSAVDHGQIAAGSVLLVERFDRLTRQDEMEALELVMGIARRGIVIDTAEGTLTKSSGMPEIISAIIHLSRGHSESQAKSDRQSANWQHKRDMAAAEGRPMTRMIPAWLRVEKGRFVVDEKAASAVGHIFKLASSGMGKNGIVKRLNRDGTPPIGKAAIWHYGYVCKILTNRAVLGEYQPASGKGKNRKPVGKPMPDYFPRIIDDKTWYAAQATAESRHKAQGRTDGMLHNLFRGLLVDATDGGTMMLNRDKVGKRNIFNSNAKLGIAPFVSFRYEPIEEAVLMFVSEIKPADLLQTADGAVDAVAELEGRLGEINARLEKIARAMMDDGNIATLATAAKRLEAQRDELQAALQTARRQITTPATAALDDAHDLLKALANMPPDKRNEARQMLATKLRMLFEKIHIHIQRKSTCQSRAYLQVHYRSGAVRQAVIDYARGHQPAIVVSPIRRVPDPDITSAKVRAALDRAAEQYGLDTILMPA